MSTIRNERRGARDGQVREGADGPRDGRPFADVIAERDRRDEREHEARREEHGAGHDRHVQAGDGQDVNEAGVAIGGIRCLRDAAALARYERDGDRALLAGEDGRDALGDRLAEPIEGRAHLEIPGHRGGDRCGLWHRERVADAAEAEEPGLTREVIAAGERGAGGRREHRAHADRVASLEGRVGCECAHADARRQALRAEAGNVVNADGNALAALLARFDELDPTGDRQRAPLACDDRSGDDVGAGLGKCKAEHGREQCAACDCRRAAFAPAPANDGCDRQRAGRCERGRLEPQREVGGNAAAEQNRRPEEPAVLLALERAHCCGEELPHATPVRRHGRGASCESKVCRDAVAPSARTGLPPCNPLGGHPRTPVFYGFGASRERAAVPSPRPLRGEG